MTSKLYYHSLDSTMLEYDRLHALGAKADSYVIRAGRQNAGMGRNNSQWYSPEGGLWLSFDLFYPRSVPSFALYIGCCVHKLLSRLFSLTDLSIKWPNDLYLGDAKLGGILCQHKPAEFRYIIGLGINTNVKADDVLHQVNAAILSVYIGFIVSNTLLSDMIIHTVEKSKAQLDDPASYLEYCNCHLYGRHSMAEVDSTAGIQSGVISKIDNSGCLELLQSDGTIISVDHGSLRIMDQN